MTAAARPVPSAPDTRPNSQARRVHLVGSLPRPVSPDVGAGMRWVLDHARGAELRALPCDRDPFWITRYVHSRAQNAAFEVVRTGDCTGYTDIPAYRVRSGRRLTIADVALGRPAEAAAAVEIWRELRAGFPELPPVQVSVPSPLDLALFTLGNPVRALRYYGIFEQMVITEVTAIAAQHGPDEVAFQLESPAVLYLLRHASATVANVIARQLARVVASVPESTRWTLHLCYGDLAHKSLFTPTDLEPVVLVVNALARRLAQHGRSMPAVHVPMAHGDQPPFQDPGAYAPLRRLVRRVGVIAGCVDERSPELTEKALRYSERALGHRVIGVAAACGYGRRAPADAEANLELACRLASS
ncbi:hypothetical protein [Saccharopolyspora taberi]|uniref:Uncharacterized protein n=1 Tax=Saccharopolyspora taberi TaxID=60895 RepID=A0ABN3VFJ8_9PSEU